MLYATPELDGDECRICDEIEAARQRLDQIPIGEWQRPLWAGRLWRLMWRNATSPHELSTGDSSDAAPLKVTATAQAADHAYRRAMTYSLRLAADPHFEYSVALLKHLHYTVSDYGGGRRPGMIREGDVVVDNGATAYRAPPSGHITGLLAELVIVLNEPSATPSVVRAAMAYFHLASIHPFSDGNGRTARCLHAVVLARAGCLSSAFCSLDQYWGHHTQASDDTIRAVCGDAWQPTRDTRAWIRFCLRGHLWQITRLDHKKRILMGLGRVIQEAVINTGSSPWMAALLLDAAVGRPLTPDGGDGSPDQLRLLSAQQLQAAASAGLLVPSSSSGRPAAYVLCEPLRTATRAVMETPFVFCEPFPPAAPAIGAFVQSGSDFWKA